MSSSIAVTIHPCASQRESIERCRAALAVFRDEHHLVVAELAALTEQNNTLKATNRVLREQIEILQTMCLQFWEWIMHSAKMVHGIVTV